MTANKVTDVLLQLAGYGAESYLLEQSNDPSRSIVSVDKDAFILHELGQIASDHAYIRAQIASTCRSRSCIIRAMTAELKRHVGGFVDFVAETERMIIANHKSIVVEGEISLTKLYTHYTRPRRILRHFRHLMEFSASAVLRSGDAKPALVYDRICDDSRTGYSDLATIANDLVRSVDRILMLQIKKWVLYGQLYSSFGPDFFVVRGASDDFDFIPENCPACIGSDVGKKVYDLGMILLKVTRGAIHPEITCPRGIAQIRNHEAMLDHIQSPIRADALSSALDCIRHSVSQITLRRLIPKSSIDHLQKFLQAYFLLENGQFSLALIERSQTDFRSMRRAVGIIKDSTLQALLSKTLTSLGDTLEDSSLHINPTALEMSLLQSEDVPLRVHFSDFLFGVRARLTINLEWPLDIIMSEAVRDAYSDLFDYLIALERALERLNELWRSRRTGAKLSATSNMTWAALYRARAFLSTLLEYYHVDVIKVFINRLSVELQSERRLYDPSELAQEHGILVDNLSKRILMHDYNFGKIMRQLLLAIDSTVGTLQQSGDDVLFRCSTMLTLVDRAVHELKLEKGVDILLLKLQLDLPSR